ncbi:MAG: TIGR01459 family HAD-type hydrolase [Ponticaulis sp.]|nr:TIGR01459 family HAD-type hydrolase [Ponticaulis sp.]
MSSLQFPEGLSEIQSRYDAILCDVWGVIHNGRSAFHDACDALAEFRRLGKPVVLITNAPVRAAQVEDLFPGLGVRPDCFNATASSGDATRLVLEKRAPGPAYRMGTDSSRERDDTLFAGLDLKFSEPEEAEFIVAMGLRDQLNDMPEDYRDELKALASRKLDMVCANPDIQVRVGHQLIWCAGALAQIYEEEGGVVIYPGKPHAAIYDLAYRHLERILGVVPDKSRILAIGDGPATDMKGAMSQGLDSLYVGTGLNQSQANFEDDTRALFERYGVTASYALPGLCW